MTRYPLRYPTVPILAAAGIFAAASSLPAQESRSTQARKPRGPSQRELLFSATGGGAMSALAGVFVTSMVYVTVCDENDPANQGWFACFPSDEAVAIGWYGGSFVGAAAVAATYAAQRGCPPEKAVLRATLGAALGVVPGLIARNTQLNRTPGGRQDIAIATPLAAGLGAYIATVGCRR